MTDTEVDSGLCGTQNEKAPVKNGNDVENLSPKAASGPVDSRKSSLGDFAKKMKARLLSPSGDLGISLV